MSTDHINGNYRPCGNRDRRKYEVGSFIIPQAALCTLQKEHMPQRKHEPGNLRYSPNVGSMLDLRRRRWADIDSTLGSCLVVYVYSTVNEPSAGRLFHSGRMNDSALNSESGFKVFSGHNIVFYRFI